MTTPPSHASYLRWALATELLLVFTIFAVAVAQANVIIVFPSMKADLALSFDNADASLVNALGNAGTIVGSVVVMLVGNRLGGAGMVLVATGCSSAAAFGFGLSRAVPLFAAIYTVHCTAAALAWPGATVVLRCWFAPTARGRAIGVLAAGARVGGVVGSLITGGLLSVMSWSQIVFAGGGFVGASFLLNALLLRSSPAQRGVAVDGDVRHEPNSRTQSLREILWHMATAPAFWFLLVANSCAAVLLELQAFAALYLVDRFEVAPSAGGLAAAVFPGGMTLTVLLGGWLSDHASRTASNKVFSVAAALGVLWVLLLWALPPNIPSGYVATLFLLFLVGVAATIIPALVVPLFAMEFGGEGTCAAVIAAQSVFASITALVFDFSVSTLAQSANWTAVLLILLAVWTVGVVFFLLFLASWGRAGAPTAVVVPALPASASVAA